MKKSGNGKKRRNSKQQWQPIGQASLSVLPVDMKIHLWYNKCTSQWRWTLTSELDPRTMESGNSLSLKDAMGDVVRTVEWMMETQEE